MATKEVMATAPLVVLLYDRTFLGGSFRKALAARWGLYIALAASWGVVWWQLWFTGFHGDTTGFHVGKFFALDLFCYTQAEVLARYLRLTFWPAGLCLDYGWRAAEPAAGSSPAGAADRRATGGNRLGIVQNSRRLNFWGPRFLVLAPTSSFIPIADAAFEHRMYLPLAAVVDAVCRFWPATSLFDRLVAAIGGMEASSRSPAGECFWLAVLVRCGWSGFRLGDARTACRLLIPEPRNVARRRQTASA